MKKFTLTLKGVTPLIMHNARLADPLDTIVRQMKPLSAKRSKTEEDLLEIARLEFVGGLYFDADLGPVMPAMNIEATLRDGAKTFKKGKDITRGLQVTDMVVPVAYKGPRDIDGLWGGGDSEFVYRTSVVVQRNRVQRTRPIFRNWALEVNGVFDENIFDEDVLNTICETAGMMSGLGDYRPRYGKFTHELEVH